MSHPGQKPAYWREGQRVCRNETDDLGTIVQANRYIKVKWDSGRTSYFRCDRPAQLHSADNRSAPRHLAVGFANMRVRYGSFTTL